MGLYLVGLSVLISNFFRKLLKNNYCINIYFKNYTKSFVVINIIVILHRFLTQGLYNNIMDREKYKRKKSLKQTRDAIIKIKNSVPKIIFRAKNVIVTLTSESQISRWMEIYPEGEYTINY